jgi:methionyl-tRNA formyltransferase
MKIVLLTNDAPNQHALVAKVAASFDIAGIVIEKRNQKKKRKTINYIEAFLDRTVFNALRKAWTGMLDYYRLNYSLPDVKNITVSNINDQRTIDFINQKQPDLLMVSGTSIVKKPILSLYIPKGIVNLHTGLSPYVKGGPNCTNWCLANGDFQFIGNTVMWLNEGIDSGDIIATETTIFTGKETLQQLHLKVMEHAHDLYIRCLKLIDKKGKFQGTNQDTIAAGVTYYTKQWTVSKKMKVLFNFNKWKAYIKSKPSAENIKVINPFTAKA